MLNFDQLILSIYLTLEWNLELMQYQTLNFIIENSNSQMLLVLIKLI